MHHASSVSLYPASDPGFAALPVEELLAAEGELIARIKLCYGADRADFERDILSLVRRYAACVHLLPATPNNFFSTPGGLFRLGLETAFYSLQGADAHIFSGRLSITARRQLEPRWRYATFIAGLCCELHRLLSHLIVTDARGETWPAFLLPLGDWLAGRQAEHYFVRWRPQVSEARGLGLFALPQVVSAAVMSHLAEGNTVIVPHLLASIGGVPLYREHNILGELVRRSLALVIDRNLAANADRYGSPQFGSHLERYLVDALRRLAAGHASWISNREKSRLWFGRDGLFLVWPGAAEDVQQLLEADQLVGIPKAPETMLELLLAAKVFAPATADRATRSIQPPGAKAPLEAVKLSNPAILLAGIDPPPAALPQDLESKPAATPSTVPATKTAGPAPASAPLSPAQMPLISQESASAEVPGQAPQEPAAAGPVQPPHPQISLQAPLRLNPLVREALAHALSTCNERSGPPTVYRVDKGCFIPLDEFIRYGVQPSVALRALADTDMLVKPDAQGPPTSARRIGEQTVVGVTIAASHIEGFAFLPAEDGTDT
jgi:conjugal transfer pilus assembly protein TraI